MNVEEEIASFVCNLSFDDLEESVIHEVGRRITDSFGVATASIDSPPAAAFHHALDFYKGEAHLIGGGTASADAASFYNSLLIRYLDFNDTYLSREPLHPSDMIGTLLSVGSLFKSDAKSLFTAIAAGYEVGIRLCDSASPRKHGLDHVNFLQIGMAAALSKLLNLDEKQTINVISITTVPHIALRESRVGDLSMWKAGAAANASRNATFAALATLNGFTAPSTPISGKLGLRNVLLPELDVSKLHDIKKADAILRTYVKKYPVEYHAQAAVDAALKIHSKLDGAAISRVEVETYEAGRSILADLEKWAPANRETADHSLPFIVAAALHTGRFWLDTYSLIGDAGVRELMSKVEVVERRDFTESYPGLLPTRIVVHAANGIHQEELSVPHGHYKNPMTDAELDEKFLMLTKDRKLLEKMHLAEKTRVDQLV